MNRFERWMLRKLIRKHLPLGKRKELFKILWEEQGYLYYEDNIETKKQHLFCMIQEQADQEINYTFKD